MAGRVVMPLHNIDAQLIGYVGRWPGDPGKERPKYKGLPQVFQSFGVRSAKRWRCVAIPCLCRLALR